MTSSSGADLDPSERAHIRRQEVVAELGQHALETDGLEDVLQEATATIAKTLETEFAAVLESLPLTDECVLRQGVGCRDDCIGTATISTIPDSQVGRALRSERPIVTDDLRTNERFSDLDSLTDHGVVSGIAVRIGPAEDPWGALTAHATDRRQFTEHDATLVRNVANILAMAIENERTERRFEAVFDDPNILVGLLEPDGTVIDINRTAMEYIDADLADVTGEQFWETPWWGDGGEVRSDVKAWTERAAAGEYVEFETDIFGPDEQQHTVNGVFRPVTNDEGDVVSIVVSDRDVTERTEHERYLRDAKEQLEAATEAGAVGTWEWKIPENQMTVGTSFAKTFGIDPADARDGVPLEWFIDAIHEDDRDRVEAAIEDAVERCGEYEAEYRVWNADDELRWVVARGHVESDDDGNPVTFPGALTDITERKRAELEVEKQRKELETLFQVLPVGAVVANGDGSLLRANDSAKEIWGGDVFDAESIAEYEKYSAVWAETGEPVEPEDWTMAQVLRGEEVAEPNVYEIETFDGDRRIIMEHGMPVRDDCGNVSRAVVTLTDITERRESQRKLEETVEQVEESNERLEQFAYAASHDLQEPLRMVTSYLQLLESRYSDAFDEDGQEFLEFAVDGAERMHEMIDGLLEYSRVETRGDPLEPIDLETALGDVIDDLQLQIEETDAEITVGDLPVVEGDASQLRQVFQNLLDNALTYYADDPPRVHVDAQRRGREWVLTVRDEGIGIDPENQDRVFTVFDRLHSREEYEGTGIGLALCQRIVERHGVRPSSERPGSTDERRESVGGEIWVDSEPGDGTTFSLTLPARDET